MLKKNKTNTASERFEPLSDKTPCAYSEAIRALRTNVEFAASTGNCKAIMLTSTLAGEGKTSIAINLAISLAKSGKKVILLDCDLRRPKIQRYLRIKNFSQNGVSTVLSGATELDSVIGYMEELGIYVVLSGVIPPNSSELLNSENAKKIIEALKLRFDYIICDLPPVGVVSDALTFSRYIDGTIFVVQQNFASRTQVVKSVSDLQSVNAKILGTVINNYNIKDDSSYGYRNNYDRYGLYE